MFPRSSVLEHLSRNQSHIAPLTILASIAYQDRMSELLLTRLLRPKSACRAFHDTDVRGCRCHRRSSATNDGGLAVHVEISVHTAAPAVVDYEIIRWSASCPQRAILQLQAHHHPGSSLIPTPALSWV